MDWATRKVLAWRLSTTLTTDFCIDALEEALHRYGAPEIFNTDQGAQFTSAAFVGVLRANDIQISMDGKGCWRDNVFVECLWRSVKYQEVYLHAYETVSDVRAGLTRYFTFFNERRPHQAGATPLISKNIRRIAQSARKARARSVMSKYQPKLAPTATRPSSVESSRPLPMRVRTEASSRTRFRNQRASGLGIVNPVAPLTP